MENPGRLMLLKALAARRERWDLRWSLRLPDAVYILPQKSHLKFLNKLLYQGNCWMVQKLPVGFFSTVRPDVVVVVTGGGKTFTTNVTGIRFFTLNQRDVK